MSQKLRHFDIRSILVTKVLTGTIIHNTPKLEILLRKSPRALPSQYKTKQFLGKLRNCRKIPAVNHARKRERRKVVVQKIVAMNHRSTVMQTQWDVTATALNVTSRRGSRESVSNGPAMSCNGNNRFNYDAPRRFRVAR